MTNLDRIKSIHNRVNQGPDFPERFRSSNGDPIIIAPMRGIFTVRGRAGFLPRPQHSSSERRRRRRRRNEPETGEAALA